MATQHSLLKEYLAIKNRKERREALVHYAQSLMINVSDIKTVNGKIDEDELTVHIYDAEQKKIRAKDTAVGFFVALAIIFAILGGCIAIFFIMFSGPKG